MGCKSSAAIGRVRAEKIDARHLTAKAVIENVANGALRKPRSRINTERGIALPGRGWVDDQWLIQRLTALEHGATRPILVRQSNTRVHIAESHIIQQRRRYRMRQVCDQTCARPKEAVLYGGKSIAHDS